MAVPERETDVAADVAAAEDEAVAILEDFRAFLDDPVALLERVLELLRKRSVTVLT